MEPRLVHAMLFVFNEDKKKREFCMFKLLRKKRLGADFQGFMLGLSACTPSPQNLSKFLDPLTHEKQLFLFRELYYCCDTVVGSKEN